MQQVLDNTVQPIAGDPKSTWPCADCMIPKNDKLIADRAFDASSLLSINKCMLYQKALQPAITKDFQLHATPGKNKHYLT